MKNNQKYQYYVEGEHEKKLLDIFKTDLQCIHPGKVEVFNPITRKISKSKIMKLSNGTIIILVFDSDVEECQILKDNISFLSSQKNVKDVWCVIQVKNIEEELCRSCDLKTIQLLTNSKTKKDFKNDLMKINNLSN